MPLARKDQARRDGSSHMLLPGSSETEGGENEYKAQNPWMEGDC